MIRQSAHDAALGLAALDSATDRHHRGSPRFQPVYFMVCQALIELCLSIRRTSEAGSLLSGLVSTTTYCACDIEWAFIAGINSFIGYLGTKENNTARESELTAAAERVLAGVAR